MDRIEIVARKYVCFALMLALFVPLVGCVGMIANLMHVAGVDMVPAAFPGLAEHRVAVVCVSNSDFFGPTSTASELGRRITRLLGSKVSKIEVIEQQQIEDWIDQNNWDSVDFRAIGKGVDAQMVVAVDVHSFSLHEGKTMYKGRADVEVVVYDMTQGGKAVFSQSPKQVQYPNSGGVYTTEISERQFRQRFLDFVACALREISTVSTWQTTTHWTTICWPPRVRGG